MQKLSGYYNSIQEKKEPCGDGQAPLSLLTSLIQEAVARWANKSSFAVVESAAKEKLSGYTPIQEKEPCLLSVQEKSTLSSHVSELWAKQSTLTAQVLQPYISPSRLLKRSLLGEVRRRENTRPLWGAMRPNARGTAHCSSSLSVPAPSCVCVCVQGARCLSTAPFPDPKVGGVLLHVRIGRGSESREELWHEFNVEPKELADLARQLLAEYRVVLFAQTSAKGIALELQCKICMHHAPRTRPARMCERVLADRRVYVLCAVLRTFAADLDVPAFVLRRSLSTWRRLLTADLFQWVKEMHRTKKRNVPVLPTNADDRQGLYF